MATKLEGLLAQAKWQVQGHLMETEWSMSVEQARERAGRHVALAQERAEYTLKHLVEVFEHEGVSRELALQIIQELAATM